MSWPGVLSLCALGAIVAIFVDDLIQRFRKS